MGLFFTEVVYHVVTGSVLMFSKLFIPPAYVQFFFFLHVFFHVLASYGVSYVIVQFDVSWASLILTRNWYEILTPPPDDMAGVQ